MFVLEVCSFFNCFFFLLKIPFSQRLFIIHIPHIIFSTSYFISSLATISIKRVNAMPLWDFCVSHFEVVLKIIIMSELFNVMTINIDNTENDHSRSHSP